MLFELQILCFYAQYHLQSLCIIKAVILLPPLFNCYAKLTFLYRTPQFKAAVCELKYMSIRFPFMAPPVSSATYVLPSITTLEPRGITLGSTAIVLPACGITPDAVGPPAHCPQHLLQLQYAVILNCPKCLPPLAEVC